MKERGKYLKKGQVLVFFLVFIALCGLIVITVGIDIFRVSQTKIMLQTAVDGRALHIISLFAKQLNFLADINMQMLQPGEDLYKDRRSSEGWKKFSKTRGSGGSWSNSTTFTCGMRNYTTHSEGGTADTECGCPKDHTDPVSFVKSPVIWTKPPAIDETSNRAFAAFYTAEEYRDDFIIPRAKLQNKALRKVGRKGSGLISKIGNADLELGSDSTVTPKANSDGNFDTYRYSHWNPVGDSANQLIKQKNRQSVDLPYVTWDQYHSQWTHSYTSGTTPGCICTIDKYWWEPDTSTSMKCPGWLYDDGNISGSAEVRANREMTGLKFGSKDHIKEKDFKAEASVELDVNSGSLWPSPDSSFKIKFK